MWLPGGDAGIDGVGWSESFHCVGGGEGMWLMVRKVDMNETSVVWCRNKVVAYDAVSLLQPSPGHYLGQSSWPLEDSAGLFEGANSDGGA